MAKASLNMLTKTSASEYSKWRIWMNSVDPGWISELQPFRTRIGIAKKHGLVSRNPVDDLDATARILDPIFATINRGITFYGQLFKDYKISSWS